MMNDREFQEALQAIESLPDTSGGGLSSPRQVRNKRLDFAYKRRGLFEGLLAKADASLADVNAEIGRLVEAESAELASDSPPASVPMRRVTDIIVDQDTK